MHGLVIKNTGFWYTVLTDEGKTIDCKVKGNFRLKGIRTTNPVAVGDKVTLSTPDENKGSAGGEGTAFITAIDDRRNYIIRKSQNLSKQSHIIAANVDQACLVVTVNHPQTSTTFIDRFLASAEAYRVPVILVFNKTDLLDDDELRYQEMMMGLYRMIGYECIELSAETGEGVETLRPMLDGKVTLFSGNSGVGKSTLLNRLIPGLNLRTAEISDAHDTGMHTTTFSEMIPLEGESFEKHDSSAVMNRTAEPQDHKTEEPQDRGTAEPGSLKTWLIDTPGIRGFGTFDMEPEEICGYFKEIFRVSKDCRFGNCTHTHEPGCAVIKAVEDHYIALSRYNSYLSMLNDKDEGKYRAAY